MKVRRLHLKDFKGFSELELYFDEGINIIKGPNESGKSTIVEAILVGLFSRPQPDTRQARSYFRWGAISAPLITVEFTAGERRFRISKDFASATAVLEEEGQPELTSWKAVNARINEVFGFSDPARYLRTACVTREQVTAISGDGAGAQRIAAMLREIVVGDASPARIEAVISSLNTRISELERGLERPASNPGSIKRLNDSIEEHTEKRQAMAGSVHRCNMQRRRLDEILLRLEEIEPRLEEVEETLARASRAQELDENARRSEERYASAESVTRAITDLRAIEETIRSHYGGRGEEILSLEPELRRLHNQRESLAMLAGQLETSVVGEASTEARAAGSLPTRFRDTMKEGGWRITMAAAFLLFVIGTATGILLDPILFVVFAVAGLVVLVPALYNAPFFNLDKIERMRLPSPEEGLTAPEKERIGKAWQQVELLENREMELLRSMGCNSMRDFYDLHDRYRKLLADRDMALAASNALLGDRTAEEHEQVRVRASLESTAQMQELGELRAYRLQPEEARSLERERKGLQKEVERLRKERDGIGFHLACSEDNTEELLQLEEEIAGLEASRTASIRRLKVLRLSLDAMRRTAAVLVSHSMPALSRTVGTTLSNLTNGRYSEVRVDEADLSVSVFSPSKQQYLPAGELLGSLSGGTVNQVYLAVRLELVKMLSAMVRPPLLFDDSFAHLDEVRLEALWGTLKEFANEHQVFLLTCSNRYDRYFDVGDNIIELVAFPGE